MKKKDSPQVRSVTSLTIKKKTSIDFFEKQVNEDIAKIQRDHLKSELPKPKPQQPDQGDQDPEKVAKNTLIDMI